ncbi:DNA replication ATP-dependent helicase/nuclease [Aphelenchoides besseyi]|nr:DNA replication ATP-dependent helicase/nuclease [Aphelenchoides besseyi]
MPHDVPLLIIVLQPTTMRLFKDYREPVREIKKDNDCCFGYIVSQNEETRFVGFSHTHSAVDNVMMKLKGSVPDFQILRVGAEKSLHPDVMDYGLDARIEKISGMSRLDLTQKMVHLKRALFFIGSSWRYLFDDQ